MESQGIPYLPHYVRVFQGVIEISDYEDPIYYQDSRGLEAFLSQRALLLGFPLPQIVITVKVAAKATKLLPMSGAEPVYQPKRWNRQPRRNNNNCYAYATNKMTNTYPQPGRASGVFPAFNCADYVKAAEADGLVKANCDNACPRGSFKVALVIDPTVGNEDYHWYRQDNNGLWSHKMGTDPATNLDNSGNIITDPRTADRGTYTTFCECFCVRPRRVTIRDLSLLMDTF